MQKEQKVTHPFIMMGTKKGALKRGAQKVLQSDLLTIDCFTGFMYNPTLQQIKNKPPMCSLRIVTEKRTIAILSSRYLDFKTLKRYVRDAEKLTQKKEVKKQNK